MNLTALARGRNCEIRVPGDCDRLGAFGCRRCHDIVDGRAGSWVAYPQTLRDLMLLEGTARTLAILVNEGVILVPEIQERAPKLRKIFPRRMP